MISHLILRGGVFLEGGVSVHDGRRSSLLAKSCGFTTRDTCKTCTWLSSKAPSSTLTRTVRCSFFLVPCTCAILLVPRRASVPHLGPCS